MVAESLQVLLVCGLTCLSWETAVCEPWWGPEYDGDGAVGNWCQLLGPLWKQEAAHRCDCGSVRHGGGWAAPRFSLSL